MTLSKRERSILYVTIAVVVGAVLWTQAIAPLYDQYVMLQEELERERATFNKNVEILKNAKNIELGYRRIEAQFPKEEPGKIPEHAFSEDVDAAAEALLPGERRTIEPVQHEEIKGVNEYEFLTLAMNITGELPKLAQLLKGFDQKGFLIKSIVLTHSKGIDNPELQLNVTLARIVKIEETEQTGPRRPGSRRLGGRRL
ncbi:MAG: hypothetical protein D6691_07300 [Candidatus Hydrogenedentota bacterium]|jgi:hypothetical protein|uniref:Uncharacterized protein n=1 Tax=Sumerlaea chitinivorans TaxID=2250252 RepID=A0A2Z4Y608_SUMC1|nr:hypothetical protein BRCON_1642 [Candidatus Sumerlaea chitinivorans]MCX7964285.1 hypothetical protein [Candidatus Sumerlaea chitinivorans]RMH26969.1 MAG: hypothetical protein D6691_07300 [Candidatus Hydrogenedentota bacterium]GIX45745.1 MAG: hypothetical protein KatS3mg130_2153 [Candidatus Sumerlaea sp.]